MTHGRVLGAAAAVALSGLAATPGAHAATPGARSVVTRASTSIGALAPSTRRDVTLVLRSRHAQTLAGLVARHERVSRAAFRARYGPSAASVRAVRRFAARSDLTVDSVAANRRVVRLSGSAARMGAALDVRYRRFRTARGATYVTTLGTAHLPAAVARRTAAIVGLSDAGAVSLAQTRAATVGLPSTYGPKQLATLYGGDGAATGAGQSLSIITEGDLTKPRADLTTFEDTFGLGHVTWDQIDVGAASTDTAGDDEWDLDSQYSTGMAPGVTTLHVYDGTSLSNDDILATINRWVSDDKSAQGSFSAGECEALAAVTGFTDGLDAVLAQAAAQGQTLFTASGDAGSQCPVGPAGVNGTPIGAPGVEYPASSPGAIGVGGTTVLGDGPSEISWVTGGGGTSLFEAVPAFQANAGGSFLGVERGVPDVALDADPNSGYEVIVDGAQEVIGGTSASAPAWQGIWARAQATHGGTLGFAGPVIYGAPASAFNDITLGTNGIFPATSGWDYDTGRGTPKIAAFAAGA